MNKLYRLLSVLLIVALMPAFVTYASADAGISVTSDSAKENLEFLSMLNITESSDNVDFERKVTRAEFVYMAVNMLNLSVFSKNDGTFTDVDEDNPYASHIYTAYNQGLLKGTSQTTFSPDEPITYAAAVKILVALLGYEEYAFLKGGYPVGYLTQAKEIGILDGVFVNATNDKLSYADVLKLISNSLTIDLRLVYTVGDDYVETAVAKGDNCLTRYHNLTHISGVAQTAGYHSMIEGYTAEESFVEINDKSLNSHLSDAQNYLGFSVDAWYDKDNNLVAIRKTTSNNTMDISAESVLEYSSFKLTVETDAEKGKTKTYNLNKGYTFVLNGRAIAPTASDFIFENGTLTLIDNDDDNLYDVVIANKKTYVVIRGINASTKMVFDQKQGDIGLILKNEDGYHCTIKKDGVQIEASTLVTNTALEVAISGDGFLADATVCTKSVKGTVDEIAKDHLYIDGVPYEKTSYFKNHFNPALGQKGTFLLDTRGKLIYITGQYVDSVQYGYFLDYASRKASLSEGDVQMKIFTDSGEVKDFELAENVIFDGNNVKRSSDSIKNHFKPERSGATAVPVYQLIRFATNSEGKIRLIDTASELDDTITDPLQKYSSAPASNDSLTRYVNASKPIDSTERPKLVSNSYWRKVGNAFIPHFTLGDTIMMEVPEGLRDNNAPDEPYDESAFRIIGTGNLPNYDYMFIDAFDYDETMTPKIVVLYRGLEKPGETTLVEPDQYAPIHLVEKVVDCITDEGDVTKRVYSYADEAFQITDIAPEVVESLIASDLIPKPGEAVRLSFNAGEINGIARDIRNITKDSVTVNVEDSKIGKTCTSTHTYITGKVLSCTDGANMVIKYDFYPMPEEGTTDYKNSPYAFPEDGICSVRIDSATTIAIYNTDTGLVEHGHISEVVDIKSVGEDGASYVCVGLDGYDPEMLIIYR